MSRLRRLCSHLVPDAVPCGAVTVSAAVLGALGGAAVTHFAHRRVQQTQQQQQQQSAEAEAEAEAESTQMRQPRPHAVTTEAELRALLPPRPAGVGDKVHGTGVNDAIKVRVRLPRSCSIQRRTHTHISMPINVRKSLSARFVGRGGLCTV